MSLLANERWLRSERGINSSLTRLAVMLDNADKDKTLDEVLHDNRREMYEALTTIGKMAAGDDAADYLLRMIEDCALTILSQIEAEAA